MGNVTRFGARTAHGAASFRCAACGEVAGVCRADWSTEVRTDDGFYDCTMGTCPNGHRHMVDD